MKVVTVMNNFARGGGDFAALEALTALVERGHEAVLLNDRPEVAEGFPVRVRQVDVGPKLSTRTWRTLLMRTGPLVARLRRELEAEAPYDVLVLHYKKEQLFAPALPRRLRPAIAWFEWGPVPPAMRKGLPRKAYLKAVDSAGVIMAVSEGTRRSLLDVGVPDEKIVLVNNVLHVDEVAFTAEGRKRVRDELGIPEDAFVVGALSRFHPKKRSDVLVEAVGRLDGAHLLLGGEGETEAELRRLAAPFADRAHFVVTPREDVADYLSAFDVLVFCPSPTEGQPRAVILAQVAERPCISTGAEGVAGLIEPGTGEILSPEHDVETLAASLRAYAADPERRAREGAAARRMAVERHAADVVGAQIEGLLNRARALSAPEGILPAAARAVPPVGKALVGLWRFTPVPPPRRTARVRLADGRQMSASLADHTQRKMLFGTFEPREWPSCATCCGPATCSSTSAPTSAGSRCSPARSWGRRGASSRSSRSPAT